MDGRALEKESQNMNYRRSEELRKHKEIFFQNTFCEIFHRTALVYPDKIAVKDEKNACTYRELDEYSNALAARLIREGLRQEEVVALRPGRNLWTILGTISIWKAGGVSLYIDQCIPGEEMIHFQRESEYNILVDMDYLSGKELKREKVFINRSQMDHMATLIYTSGTTARPKGVMIEHRNISAVVSNFDLLDLSERDVVCMFANFSFVAALYDMTSTLSVGGTLDIIPEYKRRDIKQIMAHWREQGDTVSFLPPHMAIKLMKEEDSLVPLRMLLVGSELVRNLGEKPYRIMNVYAASEMCSIISVYEIRNKEKNYPIGKTVPSVNSYVVDEKGVIVEPGAQGELWLSGPQVSRGYLKREDLTGRQFVSNPFMDKDGCKIIFKTNDIVAVQPDGNLRYICRKDNMYKIRGFRVEGPAVEDAIRRLDGVEDVAVRAFMDSGGCNILCGYFCSDKRMDVKKLKEELKKIVPYYMIPSALIQLEALPRNKNNKVDRNALVPPKELDNHKLLEQLY